MKPPPPTPQTDEGQDQHFSSHCTVASASVIIIKDTNGLIERFISSSTYAHPKGLVLLNVMSIGKFHTKFFCGPLHLLVACVIPSERP
jgi:hypothetical protein